MTSRRIPVGSTSALVAAALLLAAAPICVATTAPTAASDTIRAIVGTDPQTSPEQVADERRHELFRLYEWNAFAPVWVDGDGPTVQAKEVIAILRRADAQGLRPADYAAGLLAGHLDGWKDRAASDPEAGQFDVMLTMAVLNYASDVYRGRVDPEAAGFEPLEGPMPLDLAEFAAGLARAEDPASHLAALDPPLPIFARLRTALVQARALAERADVPRLGEMSTLRPGDSDPQVPVLRSVLHALRDMNDGALVPANPNLYDDGLVAAVKRFQERHGLDVDGVVGPASLRQLQISPAERVQQIELAMERLRWLSRRLAARSIVINIPEFRLRAINDGEHLAMNVVVGKAARQTQTPIVHADMTHVVFRPYWNVPPGIARKEILPKVELDPTYLTRHRMEFNGTRVRQLPGPDNALGLVKFIFPNRHHVYLHDTPMRALFRRSRRDFSHGCIRVAEPAALAQWLLDGQEGWNRARVETAMRYGTDNRWIQLERPVPVYLFYTTVVVGPDNRPQFYEDIYGHDATLQKLLEKKVPPPYLGATAARKGGNTG